MEKLLFLYENMKIILMIIKYIHHCDTRQAGSLNTYFIPVFLIISKIIWSTHNGNYTRSKFKGFSDLNLFLTSKVSICGNAMR